MEFLEVFFIILQADMGSLYEKGNGSNGRDRNIATRIRFLGFFLLSSLKCKGGSGFLLLAGIGSEEWRQ
jgi:hypothetical protein